MKKGQIASEPSIIREPYRFQPSKPPNHIRHCEVWLQVELISGWCAYGIDFHTGSLASLTSFQANWITPLFDWSQCAWLQLIDGDAISATSSNKRGKCGIMMPPCSYCLILLPLKARHSGLHFCAIIIYFLCCLFQRQVVWRFFIMATELRT